RPKGGTASFDSGQPFPPDVVKLQRGLHVAQAIFGNIPVAALGQQPVDVHAGDSVAFGRLEAERLAVKIEIEPPRCAFPAADAIKGELFRQVAMWLGLKTVTEPVLARDGDIEEGGAQVNERHIEAAPVER